eukprot:1370922-Amorphochlora_amoeboformis.AAC.1
MYTYLYIHSQTHSNATRSPRANAALDALRSASKPHKEQAVGTRMEALSCLFQLLHRLTEARHRCAVIVYKSLVFALVETHVGVVEGDKVEEIFGCTNIL